MSKTDLVPIYYDGQDRRTEPVFRKTHLQIKADRKAGLLDGWYQENGRIFVQYRPAGLRIDDLDTLSLASGSGFDTAWSIKQSGYAGPLTWQLR